MELKCPQDGGVLTAVETMSHGSVVTRFYCDSGHTLGADEMPIRVQQIDTEIEEEEEAIEQDEQEEE